MKIQLLKKHQLPLNELKPKTLVLTSFVFLLTTFVIYGFLFSMREVVLSLNAHFYYTEINQSEYRFYDFVFAFISLIFGQIYSLKFIAESRPFTKTKTLRRASINSVSFLPNIIPLVIKFFFAVTVVASLLTLELFDNKRLVFWISILIIPVFHYSIWNTLMAKYRNILKYSFLTLALNLFLAFSLSFVKPIDYQKINKSCLNNLEQYKYDIQLPESNDWVYDKYNTDGNYISKTPIARFYIGNEKTILTDSLFEKIILKYSPNQLSTFELLIDKKTKIKHVKKVNNMINSKPNNNRIDYVFSFFEHKKDKIYFNRYHRTSSVRIHLDELTKFILDTIQKQSLKIEDYQKILKENKIKTDYYNRIKESVVLTLTTNELLFEGKAVSIDSLEKTLSNNICQKYLEFRVDDEVEYEQYVNVLSRINYVRLNLLHTAFKIKNPDKEYRPYRYKYKDDDCIFWLLNPMSKSEEDFYDYLRNN